VLDHSPCNGKSVKGTGSAADFIQNQKALGCSVSKDIGNLCHLHHKRTLSACQVIRCTYTGKDPVHDTDVCTVSRNKTSDLCHQYDQCCLTHVSRFTSHVRSCDNGNTFFVIIQIGIIRYKHVILYHLFHYRMTTVADINKTNLIDLWTDKIISLCNQCKGRKNIQRGHSFGCTLNTDNLRTDLITDTGKQLEFQCIQFIFCTQDQILQIF